MTSSEKSDSFESRLNPEQLECVRHTGSPLLIFAGAGTGKTRVIACRIAWLINHEGVAPASILAVTFTNKSADEMSERVKGLIGPRKAQAVTASTFHSLGLSILRKHCRVIGYHPNFLIYDEDDRESVLTRIAEEFKIGDELKPGLLAFIIHKLKNGMEDPKSAPPLVKRVYERYQQYLKNYNAFDFDDLIIKPVEILESSPEIRDSYRKKWKHVLIDEYQDTNPLQYKLIVLLLNREKNICAVGDDDQSIYGWRGSDISLILNFKSDFRGAKTVSLTRNYRSTMTILEAAHSVISRNAGRVEKKLWSDRGRGESLSCTVLPSEDDEAAWTARTIEELRLEKGLSWSSFAVLFRTNFQSRPFELYFRSHKIPFRLIGGYEFFERKEVKDILSYLRVIANPKDECSLLRVLNYPRRGIGDTTIGRLHQAGRDKGGLFAALETFDSSSDTKLLAKKNIRAFVDLIREYRRGFTSGKEKWHDLVKKLAEDIGYEFQLRDEGMDDDKVARRMGNISELANHMAGFRKEQPESTLWDFLFKVALISENDKEKELSEGKDDRVTMLTVHSSKGLEFGHIFIAGCENGLFPHKRTVEENEEASKVRNIDEERRLFYVALTRAKDSARLTACRSRKIFGKEQERELSVFVSDIPTELIRITTIDGPVGPSSEQTQRGFQELLARLEKKS